VGARHRRTLPPKVDSAVRLFAIADPHLSSVKPKPMDIFGSGWSRHPHAFFEGWRRVVGPDDVVLVAGDISWAMHLVDALPDLHAIAELPGQKVLLRGNHDYWWPSISKLRAQLPPGMHAIQNDALRLGRAVVGGTRGWVTPGSPGFSDEDEHVFQRELARLDLSLARMDALAATLANPYRVVMLHFPPSDPRHPEGAMVDRLRAHRPDAVVFGHVHGDGPVAIPSIPPARVEFVAGDRVGFEPVLLCDDIA
jgi:predicted phosphohydrolase